MRLLTAGLLKHAIAPVLAVGAIGAAPTSALARHHDDDRGGGIHMDLAFHVGPYFERAPAPPPVYEDREVRVWVEPVYRTVTERQWVPDRFEEREVVRREGHHQRVYREQVLVQPAHYEDVCRQELVQPGHFETHIERVRVDRR